MGDPRNHNKAKTPDNVDNGGIFQREAEEPHRKHKNRNRNCAR